MLNLLRVFHYAVALVAIAIGIKWVARGLGYID